MAAGQVLSYKGGVVESLYGATQAIVDKAHKGVGMSQTGAYAYATQGYNQSANLGNLLSKGGDSEARGKATVSLSLFLLLLSYADKPCPLSLRCCPAANCDCFCGG